MKQQIVAGIAILALSVSACSGDEEPSDTAEQSPGVTNQTQAGSLGEFASPTLGDLVTGDGGDVLGTDDGVNPTVLIDGTSASAPTSSSKVGSSSTLATVAPKAPTVTTAQTSKTTAARKATTTTTRRALTTTTTRKVLTPTTLPAVSTTAKKVSTTVASSKPAISTVVPNSAAYDLSLRTSTVRYVQRSEYDSANGSRYFWRGDISGPTKAVRIEGNGSGGASAASVIQGGVWVSVPIGSPLAVINPAGDHRALLLSLRSVVAANTVTKSGAQYKMNVTDAASLKALGALTGVGSASASWSQADVVFTMSGSKVTSITVSSDDNGYTRYNFDVVG